MEERNKLNNEDHHYDIFISYAHTDDEVLQGDGWVTILHNALRIRAKQLYGKSVKIWRDPALQINDDFSQEIEDVLSKSHAFVSILTPSYTNSDWCRRELRTFIETHKNRDSSISLGNKKRIFKVVKTPVDQKKQPPPFEKILGIDFYRKGTEPPEEFVPSYDCDEKKRTTEGALALNKLAYEIQKLLQEIIGGREKERRKSKGNIYLAATSSDLNANREDLKRELEDKDYTVLPKVDFPIAIDEIEAQMQEDIESAICSIHLVGAKYGSIPEDIDRSVVEIQVDKAFIHSKENPGFFQLIWLSGDKEFRDSRQIDFREKVDYLEFAEGRGDVVKNSFESFKAVLEEKLDVLQDKQTKSVSGEQSAKKSIYVIYSKKDEIQNLIPILLALKEKGYDPLTPVFDGDRDDNLKMNREKLDKARGVVIFWGEGDDVWFEKNCKEVREQLENQENATLKAVAIIVSTPRSGAKEIFQISKDEESCKAKIVSSYEGFSPDTLGEFLNSLTLE